MNINQLAITALAVLSFTVPGLSAADAVKVTRAAAEAAIVHKVAPAYPPIAKQMRVEGVVEVRAFVNETGQVHNVEVISGNPLLSKSAVEALMKWRFTNSKIDGNPGRWTTDVSIAFKL